MAHSSELIRRSKIALQAHIRKRRGKIVDEGTKGIIAVFEVSVQQKSKLKKNKAKYIKR